MATTKRDTSSDRKRARKQPGGRASSRTPPKARASARSARPKAEADQVQLLQGVQQTWLAGMGAVSRAQKILQSGAGNAREQAQETMDNIEALFQNRVQRALHQLGVPTAEEIHVLTRRVAELNENVCKLISRERLRQPARSSGATRRRVPQKRSTSTRHGGAAGDAVT